VSESTVRIVMALPELMGTYGDAGNALVLRRRCEWRGIEAEITSVPVEDAVPDSADIYLLGGAETNAQVLATERLQSDGGLSRAAERGAVVFAVCAGLQILGTQFPDVDGTLIAGLGLLDVVTRQLPVPRAIGEVISDPDPSLGISVLTGFENHGGRTTVGPAAKPLGRVRHGVGNGGGGGDDGAIQGRVVGTYLHGPALARNPDLADLLLGWVVGPLDPLPREEVDEWRRERLHAFDRPDDGRRARLGRAVRSTGRWRRGS
jgi:CobQ-like glutamine amidotransferase family enzyme